jgi:hypothetical protein
VMVNVFTQPCALPVLSAAPVVRTHEGTRVFSAVEAQAASATGASFRAVRSAGAEDLPQVSSLPVSSCWRASGSSSAASLVESVPTAGVVIEAAAGHEAAEAVSVLGLKRVALLAGVGLDVRRPVVPVIEGGLERRAADAPLAAPSAGGRGRQMQDQRQEQDQFGTTGVGNDGYAFGIAAASTNPIDPRDHRTSSPPG